MITPPRWPLLLLVASLFLVVACGSGGDDDALLHLPGAADPLDDPFSGGYPTYRDADSGIDIVFGTPDIAAGDPRVSFALFNRDGLISAPTVEVTPSYYPDGPEGDPVEGEPRSLAFTSFPQGGRGIYSGMLHFDAPGLWALAVRVSQPDGQTTVRFPVHLLEQTEAPDVGDPAPRSEQRTLADVEDASMLTTANVPDERLYDRRIAGVIASGEPFVVTFASPAFCTNALCGPQVEVLSELADRYDDRARFIHVDLYENPAEIQGDLAAAVRTPVLEEWGVETDEWTFVVGGDGIVRARFEGFVPRAEVEAALETVLGG